MVYSMKELIESHIPTPPTLELEWYGDYTESIIKELDLLDIFIDGGIKEVRTIGDLIINQALGY